MKTATKRTIRGWLSASCGAMALSLALAGVAQAQTTTATIRGTVEIGAAPAPNAEVVATNVQNGAVARVRAGPDGAYVLVGVEPGTYRIVATAQGQSSTQVVSVQIGQSASLDIALSAGPSGPPATASVGELVVVARPLIETKTSEVAGNITPQQIESLPQNSRNFLNFAGLVAGISTPTDPTQKTFSSAGQPPNQTNVFIDGASLKNNILQGGLVGQDSSRGNPFSQEAISEFRVLVQNFKAEYEQGGTSIITAVTKSGTNEFHGSAYGFFQNKDMTAEEHFAALAGTPKPDYSRWQYGATLGGPIIKDRLFFFLNFEGNHENGNARVAFSPTFDQATATHPAFGQFNGNFPRPFDEKVYFGKLTWLATDNDRIDLSYSHRRDNEIIGFGGQTSYETRQERLNTVEDALLNWKHHGAGWLNEFILDYGQYEFNPRPVELGVINQNYFGIGDIGGATEVQDKKQRQFTIKDDVTFSDVDWHGRHVFKIGAKVTFLREKMVENSSGNPEFDYDPNQPGGWLIPFQAIYSPSGKVAQLDNRQYGIYAQDDWDVSRRLQLNIGLRWDYETNPYNNSFVLPPDQVSYIRYLIAQPGVRNLSTDFIGDGHSRHGETDEFQPRFGFSYDLSRENDQSWVLFGGAGRYYDRTPLDNAIQEAFHSQFPYYTFQFAPTPTPGKITWDPKYLTVAGLQSLVMGNIQGSGELDLLNNKTRAPYSDQFSIGLRHRMGAWTGSVTLSRVLGYRQFTWVWANRLPIPNSFTLVTEPGVPFGVVLTNEEKNYYSTGVFVSLDKPYTEASGWGVGIAYTYEDARKQGGDAYSLDYTTPALYPQDYTSERHHVSINGTVRLPYDFHLSGLITLGTGVPFNANQTFDFQNFSSPTTGIHLGAAFPKGDWFIVPGWAYRDVDLSLSRDFHIYGSHTIQLRADVFNVFNFTNYSCFTDYARDPNFGKPNCTTGLPRSAQVSARYSF
ncbi:MAG: TonB-dependent receptor [Caulobacteraceae bacterium]